MTEPGAFPRDEASADDPLAGHLEASGLAGSLATSIHSCLLNCRRLVAGDPDTAFGLSDWRHVSYADVVAALQTCGVGLGDVRLDGDDPTGTAYIDPASTLRGISRHRDGLAALAGSGARVLLATGHAFALLPHYAALARALSAAGCTLLRPLDGQRDSVRLPDGQPASIRYLDGVATLASHGALLHTHRPEYMESMLETLGGRQEVDAVIGDHGFAGAALEAGIPTYAIADANDPGL
ncbi:MAG: phosphatase, partial [Acidimicrobiales bacterium]